jgi:integrase
LRGFLIPRQAQGPFPFPPFIFCGSGTTILGQALLSFQPKNEGSWFAGIQKPWQRLWRDAVLEDIRIHDLRHSFVSLAAANGENPYLVGHVLGHRRAIAAKRYAQVAVPPMLDVANRTAEQLFRLLQERN